MEKVWTAYDEDVGESVRLVDLELVTLANGQKVVIGESEITGKLLYRFINSEEARKYFEK